MIEFKYRPDVDGLRAVAVTLVLLFHAGLGFSGGFIGVDVFFVISGFLITGLILKEQDAGKFSLANFWLRRIRRILPLATTVAIAVLIAGFFLLMPSDYADLGQSAVAQQAMLSNVYFWRHTGYFDGPADLKPLLHTWSLAVEEQFYLGYPFLLVFLHRLGRRATFVSLAVLALGSLVVSQYGVKHHPTATFYLLPTRAWELLIGGLIWFLPRPSRISPWVLSSCSWGALGTIFAAGWFYTSTTPFPGVTALVPCLATAVLIYANSLRLSYPAAVLATRPFVFVGLISYALYLWHWPILAFCRHWTDLDAQLGVRLAALVASFVLAVLSWKFVETPFRRGMPRAKPSTVAFGAIVSAVVVVTVSQWVNVQNGFPDRLPESIRAMAEPITAPRGYSVGVEELGRGELPVLGSDRGVDQSPDFMVWGDSHAMALGPCLDSLAEEHGLSGVIAARSATVPILGVWRPYFRHGSAEALYWNDCVLDYVREHKVRNVFLIARWAVNVEGRPNGKIDSLIADENATSADRESARTAFDSGLGRTLDELEEAGARIWIIKQVPLQSFNPQRMIVRSAFTGSGAPRGVSLAEHNARKKHVNSIIDRQVDGRPGAQIVDLSDAFFDDEGFSLISSPFGGSYYRDNDHVSELGANELIRPVLQEIFIELSESK